MSIAAKERFMHKDLTHKVKNSETFPYEYEYKDKGKTFKKHIHLLNLGESKNTDLKTGDGTQQVMTDNEGELYEVYIEGLIVIAIRSLRKPDPEKKKKVEETEEVIEEAEEENEDE